SARQKVLIKLRDEKEGFSAGSKRLLQEAETPDSPLYQKLKGIYEFILPEEGAEAAVSAAMRPYMQTLVVLTEQDLDAVIAFAKQQQLKDYSLLCLQQVGRTEIKKGIQTLLNKVQDNEVARHFMQKVAVAKDRHAALQVIKQGSGLDVWVDDGALIDRQQVLF